MQLTLKPYLTTGVVLVGATAMVAAPIQVMPPDISIAPSHSVSNQAVNPAALVTDLLNAINVVHVAGGNSAKILIDSIGGLPLGLAVVTQAAINDPSLIPQLASYLTYSFLNPGPASGGVAFPQPSVLQEFGALVVLPLASLLPPPIGPTFTGPVITDPGLILTAFGAVGSVIGDSLGAILPAPNPLVLGPALMGAAGQLATNSPRLFSFLNAVNEVVGAVGEAIGGGYSLGVPGLNDTAGLAGWNGFLPTVLAATAQAAIDDPSTIPGLASYLVYSLIAPPGAAFPPPSQAPGGGTPPFQYSLFVNVFAPLIDAAENNTPDPISDAIVQFSNKLNTVLSNGLSHLPAPDNPFIQNTPMTLAAKAPAADPGPAALPRPGAFLRTTLSQNTLSAKDPKTVSNPGDVIKSVAAHLPGPGKVNASDLVKAAQAKQKKVAEKVKDAVSKATDKVKGAAE
jgi:hypothetical protein